MILLVCGGREYSMRAYDWLRLDALHMPVEMSSAADVACDLPGNVQALVHQRYNFEPGPVHALFEGGAEGADTCARAWAESRGVPYREFAVSDADWAAKGKSAGPKRNASMLLAAQREAVHLKTELVGMAFPGGVGTADMVAKLRSVGARVLDYREPPVQRWTVEDVKRVEEIAEYHSCGGDPESYAWPRAILQRWAERGAAGVPLVSAHLWTDHGRVRLPPHGALYIGRHDHRNDIAESPLCNPFRKTEGTDVETLLERYRSHLRAAYQRNVKVQELLHSIQPWTLLVCWCHADKPCHGTVVADAALQAQAACELRAAGRDLPAKHWSAYRKAA